MDNPPKENSEHNNPPKSGDIFSAADDPYEAAVHDVEETKTPDQPFIGEDGPGLSSQYPTSEEPAELSPPLPYEESPVKKIVVIIAALLIIAGIGFAVFRIFAPKPKPEAPSNITINYWGLWEEEAVFKPVIDEYQKNNPGITVKYVKQNQTQYRQRLQAALERGEGPDIFRFHNSWVPMFINLLSPVPKDIYSDEEYKNVFYPVAVSDLFRGSSFYGIPLEIDGLILFYNDDILKGSNITPPKTWTEMRDAAISLTVREKNEIVTSGVALGTAENVEHFSDILGLMFFQNGTNLNNSLFSCRDPNKKDCAVESLSFYRQFSEKPVESWNSSMDNSILSFATARTAMVFAPSWEAFTIAELAKQNSVNLNFKTAQVPQLPCLEPSGCPPVHWATYYVEGVSAKSKFQKEAWNFLKYLSSPDVMEKLFAEQVKSRILFGEPYSRRDMADKLKDHPYIAPVIESAPYMKSFYLASRAPEGETGINSVMIGYLKDAVNSLGKGSSPETALQTADSGFQQAKARFGM